MVPSSSSAVNEYTYWSRNVTLRLIDEYRNNHVKVGSKIRSFKVLYEMIANTLNIEFGLKLTGAQVNNKFQCLVRSYKAIVDNNKKTGRGRKFFEFEEEMEQIFHKSKRINPEILLSESEEIRSTHTEKPVPQKNVLLTTMQLDEPKVVQEEYKTNDPEPVLNYVRKSAGNVKRKGTKIDVLELIRKDKDKFYEQYIKIQNSKIVELIRKNDLLEEKNKLLKEYLSKQK